MKKFASFGSAFIHFIFENGAQIKSAQTPTVGSTNFQLVIIYKMKIISKGYIRLASSEKSFFKTKQVL